jgi:hypothetical protein
MKTSPQSISPAHTAQCLDCDRGMTSPGRKRVPIETRLVVVEGYGEKAALEYLRSVANIRGEGFTTSIRCARGGSPSHIVQHIINQTVFTAFERRFVVFDADRYDVEEQLKVKNLIEGTEITVIVSEPNFDELILRTLGERPPFRNAKAALVRRLGGPLEESGSYAGSLTLPVLTDARRSEPSINDILRIFGR